MKLEFDTEDQVLLTLFVTSQKVLCLKDVGCFKKVSRVLQVRLKGILSKGVSRVFEKSLKGKSWHFKDVSKDF